jgi:predicted regulator of Ras-like GTPase activity (Roadblock/LC7/MglB family)
MHGAEEKLEAFVAANPTVSFAVLTSADGVEIAAHPVRRSTTQRLAAMSSSLHALSDAMARETGLVDTRSLIIESEGGVIVVLNVSGVTPPVSLAVVARGSGILGHLLWAARNCCASLAGRMFSSNQ